MSHFFRPADILLPRRDFERFAVVACDQFTSDRGYWERVRDIVGDVPSALNLVLPEVYLSDGDTDARLSQIHEKSREYLQSDVFDVARDAFVLTRRTFGSGIARLGLVGVIDLEAYDYTRRDATIAASEQTVTERLPARIAVRRAQNIETSHVIALIDDAERGIIEPLTALQLPKLYDFTLMEGGGRVEGWRVDGELAESVADRVVALRGETKIVVGDGNHSLAAAKVAWEECKTTLTDDEKRAHPRRFALVELQNVYDGGIAFEPIHRAVFGADFARLSSELRGALAGDGAYEITVAAGEDECRFNVRDITVGEIIETAQRIIDEMGLPVDYIHGDDEARELAKRGAVSVLLPTMDKRDLFATVRTVGVFPRKSFSIGSAREKRYYLECKELDH
ncbi:MAG: DUF1015 domain-containing protein [Oscillospiraceae bacterium]|jgi:hypothetical protein|nr:DUF1015 domain-containing protein [Oscillospiraceae bacterium]